MTDPTPPAAAFSEAQVSRLLQDPARRRLLRELARSGALPVGEIARRIRINANRTTKNLRILKENGFVRRIYGHTYDLTPAIRPAPGATHFDFGEILLRIAE